LPKWWMIANGLYMPRIKGAGLTLIR